MPKGTIAVSEMRSYIFTEREREALKEWLTGKISRGESTLLHTTLTRIRRAEANLLRDFKLLALPLKKLRRTPKPRRRKRRLYATLTIAPTLIETLETQLQEYVMLIGALR